MKRAMLFAKRNITETLRDPLSYIFCLGFPIVMMIIMTIVDRAIPPEANMTVFRIDNLTGSMIVFGQCFIMLFTTLNVSKDRQSSFLIRMFATPMTAGDFAFGYLLSMVGTAFLQSLITLTAGFILSAFTGFSLNPATMIAAVFLALPSAVFFTAIGLLFGSLFNDKSAPGLCSVIISLASFLGGFWMDVEQLGGTILKICRFFPFLFCTRSVRCTIAGDFSFETFGKSMISVCITCALVCLFAVLAFRAKMKADLK